MIGNGRIGANKKGKIDVFINDQTNPLFQYFLIDEQKADILLTSAADKDDITVNVSSGHGFTAATGEMITIFENGRVMQSRVKSVSTDEITLELPLAFPLTTAATVIRGNNRINVDGSSTPVEFLFKLRQWVIPIDISKIILLATHTTISDYTTFMGIANPAVNVPNGLWFRRENDENFNLGNYKTNKDFRLKGAVVDFPDKVPSGTYATEIIFDMVDIFGQVMRFRGAANEFFKGTVRDDLSALTSMQISLIGSYTDEN